MSRHACTHCPRVFTRAWSLVRHEQACHELTKPFVCGSCGKAFAEEHKRDRHARTQHHGNHKLRCGTCGKGYDDAGRLAAHVKAHDKAVTDVVLPPRSFWANVTQEQAEELRLLRAQQQPAHSSCNGKEVCQVRAQDLNDDSLVFKCWTCKNAKRWHWACVGYDRGALSTLPVLVCLRCLMLQGKSPATCALASISRRLLEEHVTATLKRSIQRISADGWCLVRSVAEAEGQDKHQVLEAALHWLVCALPSLQLDGDERAKVVEDCQRLLSQGAARRQMRRQWDSALCDLLPQALANTVRRPLHILQVLDGDIRVLVTSPAREEADEAAAAAAAAEVAVRSPILLVRSCVELGCDHYDLVV